MKTRVLAVAAALFAFVAVSAQEPTTTQKPQTPVEQPAPKAEEPKEEPKPAAEAQTPCTEKCEAKSKESKPVAEEQTPADKPAETPAAK